MALPPGVAEQLHNVLGFPLGAGQIGHASAKVFQVVYHGARAEYIQVFLLIVHLGQGLIIGIKLQAPVDYCIKLTCLCLLQCDLAGR